MSSLQAIRETIILKNACRTPRRLSQRDVAAEEYDSILRPTVEDAEGDDDEVDDLLGDL